MKKTEKIFDKAKETVNDKDRISKLLSQTGKKLKNLASNSEWTDLKSKISVLSQMAKSHLNGEYKAFPVSSLLLIVFALIYFVTPTDALPDFIPAIGFTDDAAVLLLIYKKLSRDIEGYLKWKGANHQ